MSIFLGIDGGGTRSTLLALDETGAPLARLEGGPAILDANNPAGRANTLADLAAAALERLGAEPPADVLCCALAGARGARERTELALAISARGVARHIHVITDAEAALWDAFGTGSGVMVIAGTGSVVWGRGEDGRMLRAGGWGLLLGDEGSGYAIGLGALRAVVRTHDGRDQATALMPALLQHLGLESADLLVRWTGAATKREIAALAPLVLSIDDDAARALARIAARDLVEQIDTVTGKLAPWQQQTIPLAPAGGLIAPGRPLRQYLIEALEQARFRYRVRQEVVDGARGAALVARSHALANAG